MRPVQLAKTSGVGAGFDDYENVSPAATGLVFNTLYAKRIIDAPSPCGANCSFTQTFTGPAYKCNDIDFRTTTDPANPFCPSSLVARDTTFGNCGDVFLDSGNGLSLKGFSWYYARNSSVSQAKCKGTPTYCAGPDIAWRDGKLWVAHQFLQPSYRPLFDDFGQLKDPTNKFPLDAFERRMFVCQSYNATYTLLRRYEDSQQLIEKSIT